MRRAFSAKIGEKIPVSFMNGVEDPVIQEDSEYPAWVMDLTNPLPTKAQLLAKYNDPNFDNKDFAPKEVMRLKRLLTLAEIKESNMGA